MKSISIVIPNYNGLKLLSKNIRSIIFLKSKYKQIKEIIVVDDASTDMSVSYLSDNYPDIIIVRKAVNSGFSETVNIGFQKTKSSLVLLLNTDVKPEENLVDNLIPFFSDESVFAVGCLEKSLEDKKTIDRGRGIGIFVKGFLIHKRGEINNSNTLWVSGGSSMFNKRIWQELGGLDLEFGPFYWEDIDVSYRALKCGYKIYFARNAIIYHNHEEGAIHMHYTNQFVDRVAFRNQIMFVWKNISDSSYLTEHFIYSFYNFFVYLLTGRINFVIAYIEAVKKLPRILKERRKLKNKWKLKDKDILNQFKKDYMSISQ